MQWEDLEIPFPKNGYVTIKHSYIGINYIDTYHQVRLYPLPLASYNRDGRGWSSHRSWGVIQS